MVFTEIIEPCDHNRHGKLFVSTLGGTTGHEGMLSMEMKELSTEDDYSLTGMKEEIILLAWLIVLSRTKEGGSVSYEWAHTSADEKCQTHQLCTQDIILDPHVTLDKASNSISRQVRESGCTRKDRAFSFKLLLSSGYLAKNTVKTGGDETQHVQVAFESGKIEICPVWWTKNTSQHTLSYFTKSFADTIQECTSNLKLTFDQAMRPTESDIDEIWRINHELPPTYGFCMHEVISRVSCQLNHKVGISSWDGDLTYGQIDQWSSHLAWSLKAAGVRPHDVLPICFEKSRFTVIAILATMKVGATFALMDPSLPLARLQNMAKQVGAKTMISSTKQFNLSASIMPEGKIIAIEQSFFDKIEQARQITELPPVTPHTLMYIIFTSGSTGTPKGVKISHQTYTSSAIPRAKAVGYAEESRVLDFASYAFDVSIDSMLLTLGNGGCLCIPSDDDRLNDINSAIRRMKVNYAGLTPSVARILDSDVISSLTGGLGLGGEAVSARDANLWGQNARIIIGYGPCECTIGCTVNSSAATGRNYISIGPGNGAVIWIVDPNDHNLLMPFGAVGELLVEGPIVGQGYLNDCEKTATAFIKDPPWLFAGHKKYPGRSGRLYKTGDLGRYDPDGSGAIVFVGRKDTQVKLRGQRVELGEIESQLRARLPSDANAIAEVIEPQGAGGQPTLVAFVSSSAMESGESITSGMCITTPPASLRDVLSTVSIDLAKVVPRYMVPTAYIPVNKIPVLISGKTDRKQLRQFGASVDLRQVDHGRQESASRQLNDSEKRLCEGWSTVLKLDASAIQLEDNFFALGGDSLAAMRLVSACRSLGIDLSVIQMFSSPSLRQMAGVARSCNLELRSETAAFSLITQEPDSAVQEASQLYGFAKACIEDIYPCTPTQESLFTFSLKSEEPYLAQRVACIPAHIDTNDWKAAWEQVVTATPILRSRLAQLEEPGLQQVVLKGAMEWEYSNSLEQYLNMDKGKRMGLGDQLSRYALVQNAGDSKRYMVWSIHHVLYDGWSEPLVLHQVMKALKVGYSSEDRTLMKDFVKSIKETNEVSMQDFWEGELKNAVGPQFPRLPSRDFLPTPNETVEHDIELDLAPGYAFTIATLIRGSWALVASKYSGNDDVVFGETLSGRDTPLPGIEEIVGPIIATVPVRINARGSLTVQTFLETIQQGVSLRVPYQHMGMQNIRKVSKDAQHACEAPTGLVIQPEPDTGITELGFEVGDVVREALHFNPYPLMLGCGIRKGGFKICANFDSSLVSVSQMQRVLGQMQEVCTQLTQNLTRRIADISVTPPEELNRIWEWNQIPPLSVNKESNTFCSEVGMVLGDTYPRAVIPWVCDPQNSFLLSPIGSLGELWLEGDCFSGDIMDSPTWLQAGSPSFPGRKGRLQTTGDIVRLEEDGTHIFIGRKQDMFVQGHAINIAELQVHFAKYLPVSCAAAIGMLESPLDTGSGQLQQEFIVFLESESIIERSVQLISIPHEIVIRDKKIIISSATSSCLSSALKRLDKFLHDSLQSYMRPSAYVVVENLFNGKKPAIAQADLNYLASNIPQSILLELKQGFESTWENFSAHSNFTPKEKTLRHAWAKVLHINEEQVDRDDNFFRLGGDSVLAMKLVSNLRQQGHSLSVADIFRHMRLGDAAQVLKINQPSHQPLQSYRPFALVNQPNAESFVANIVHPKLANKDWHVQDVLPVSHSQEMDIQATIHRPKTSVQYTMLFFDQNVIRAKLFESCERLVEAHEILRTVFIQHDSQFYQVVLSHLKAPITKHRAGDNLQKSVKQICTEHVERDFELGSPFLQFLHVEGQNDRDCLVICLSHAQYDATSLPRILQDLETLYRGEDLGAFKPFSEYMTWSSDMQIQKPAIDYWRNLLGGSSLSGLSDLQAPTLKPTDKGIFQTKAVETPHHLGYITTANLLTAAWALVLSRRLQKLDVTFGGVTSGRSIGLPNVESIVGPCYQLTPIRVVFETHWTASDLLNFVQNQSANSSSYESLGFKNIAQHCTDWSSGQFFDSLVHHQDWDDFDIMPFSNGTCNVDILSPHGDAPYPTKVVSFVKDGHLHVGVVGSEHDAPFVHSVLDELASTVHELTLDVKIF